MCGGPGAYRASRARTPEGDCPTFTNEGLSGKRGGQRQNDRILIRLPIKLGNPAENSITFFQDPVPGGVLNQIAALALRCRALNSAISRERRES